VLVSFGACALPLAVLWLAVMAQAKVPPSLPAVPDVATAPQAGRSVAPPYGALPGHRSSAASHSGPAAQKPAGGLASRNERPQTTTRNAAP